MPNAEVARESQQSLQALAHREAVPSGRSRRANEMSSTGCYINRDHEQTIRLAEAAIELIKAFALPGDPPSFEIWYTYAGRFLPALNEALNRLLQSGRNVSASEVDELYDRLISPMRWGDRIGAVGERISGEVRKILATTDAAIDTSRRYRAELAQIEKRLDEPSDPAALRAVSQVLAQATMQVEERNQRLESQLKVSFEEIEKLRSDLQALYLENRSDPLTSLVNRRYFDQALSAAVSDAQASSKPLSLLMCDVDHFKAVNDTFGHPIGDDVLRLIAGSIKYLVREQDIAARYGGEEFGIILLNTPVKQAAEVAERIRTTIASRPVVIRSTGQSVGRITVSMGGAQLRPNENSRGLIERADDCLYRAKQGGRNRVVTLD